MLLLPRLCVGFFQTAACDIGDSAESFRSCLCQKIPVSRAVCFICHIDGLYRTDSCCFHCRIGIPSEIFHSRHNSGRKQKTEQGKDNRSHQISGALYLPFKGKGKNFSKSFQFVFHLISAPFRMTVPSPSQTSGGSSACCRDTSEAPGTPLR